MNASRSVRSLSGLNGAASSRVLNLLTLGVRNANNPSHWQAPIFSSKIINNAIIIKHRLRADEVESFTAPRTLATKVVVPFEKTDLSVGGQSLFVGQRGYQSLLETLGNYCDKSAFQRDAEILRLLDTAPSLDPFLIREHLRVYGHTPATSYFEIAPADQRRMYDYTAAEIRRLAILADGDSKNRGSASRMVSALLSSEVNDKLEPLRKTLALSEEEFAESIFSWRGFIYYKWCLHDFWPQLVQVMRGIHAISPYGKMTSAEHATMQTSKGLVIRGAQNSSQDVRRILNVYDSAYSALTTDQNPTLFRDFLLNARELFLDIGDKMGAMSHIASFWRYRFPNQTPRVIDVQELMDIFHDFTKSLGVRTAGTE